MLDADDLPDDIAVLKAMLIAQNGLIARLEKLVAAFRQAFGAHSNQWRLPLTWPQIREDLPGTI